MWKKWISFILAILMIVGLAFFGCKKNPTKSKTPEYPPGYAPATASGNVDLPQGISVPDSSLTITAGAFAQTKPNAAGNFSINLNEGVTQLVSATTPVGDPILLSIAIDPHSSASVKLSPRTTAEAMIFLNPAVVIADPTLSQTVMNIVKSMPETQTLANTIQSKIAVNTNALVMDDPDIKTALTNALVHFVSAIDSLTVTKSVAPEIKKEIKEFRDFKHYKEIDQKEFVNKLLQVGNLIINPATPQSGVSVSASQVDANNYKITVTNSKKRFVKAYLDNGNTGANIGKALLPSRKSLLSFSPLSPYSIDLNSNLNVSTHPNSILRAYSLGANNLSALTSAPSWQSRVAEPVILTGLFDFFVPLLQVVTGVQQAQMLGNWDTPGGALGEILSTILKDNTFLSQLGVDISYGSYTAVVTKVVIKAVKTVVQNPAYIFDWLTEQGLGGVAAVFSAAVVPLRIGFIITSGFELGAAIYDFATCSWLVSCTLTYVTPPPIPTLSQPANGDTGVATSPTLSWNASNGATSYTLQISTSSSFSSFVVNQSGITATSYAVTGLANSTKYYWRVSATNSSGSSGWSSVWNFTTISVSTCVPTLISPSEGATMDNGCTDQSDLMVWDFDWSDCQGASQYHLYVKFPTAAQPVIDDTNVTSSSYRSSDYSYIADQYYVGWTWKVRAKVNGVWGSWSETRTFNVEPVNTDCPSTGTIQFVGSYDTPGYARAVFVTDHYAYIADGSSGLQIINVSNPTNPTLAGSCPTPGNGIFVSGSYAYMASDSGLKVINVSNPSSASLVSSYGAFRSNNVFVSGNYAYVPKWGTQVGSDALDIINISDPVNPTLAGVYTGFDLDDGLTSVYVKANYAYIGAPNWSFDHCLFKIIDISNPSTPTLQGFYHEPYYAQTSVFVSGNYALVAGWDGLDIINISNPQSPSLAGRYLFADGWGDQVFVSGNYAYVSQQGFGIKVLNISDPSTPTLVGSYDTSGEARGIFVLDNYIYVADGQSGLQILKFVP